MRKVSIANLRELEAHRPAGYFEDVVSKAAKNDGEYVYLTARDYDDLQQKYSPEKFAERIQRMMQTGLEWTPSDSGPGTELKKLLALVGITATPNCSCNKRAAVMDRYGADWCEKNVDIIVGWLRQEAERRKLPFLDVVGKMLVRRAISNARKETARAKAKEGEAQGPAV